MSIINWICLGFVVPGADIYHSRPGVLEWCICLRLFDFIFLVELSPLQNTKTYKRQTYTVMSIIQLYIDPATGSMLFSVILGVFITAGFFVRILFIKLKTVLGGKSASLSEKNTYLIYIGSCNMHDDKNSIIIGLQFVKDWHVLTLK